MSTLDEEQHLTLDKSALSNIVAKFLLFHNLNTDFNDDTLAERLCLLLDIPNLSKRSGLAHVHDRLWEIIALLDHTYELGHEDDRVLRAIMGCYAKMSVDAFIAGIMIKEDVLSRLLSILGQRRCLSLTLQTFASFESHGLRSRHPSRDIFALLLSIMQEHPSDADTIDNCIYIFLNNCTMIALDDSLSRQRSQLLKLLIQHSKTATAPLYRLEALIEISFHMCWRRGDKMDSSPESKSIVTFLLATLRSRDITKRWFASYSIQRIRNGAQVLETMKANDPSFLDLLKSAMNNGLPPKMVEALGVHESRSELRLSLESWKTRTWALDQIVEHSNFYDVGVKLADLILRGGRLTEFGEECLPEYELPSLLDPGASVPLRNFFDIIPYCALAIGQTSRNAKHTEIFEILMVYRLCAILNYKGYDSKGYVLEAIKRDPSQPFFYVVLSLASRSNTEEYLRAAKKGLEVCDEEKTPEFVKISLRYMAAHAALTMANTIMGRALQELDCYDEEERNRTWGQGVIFWTSALNDFRMIVKTASPDSRYIKYSFYWYVNLLYILKGSEVDEEIEDLRKKWELINKVFIHYEDDPPITDDMVGVCNAILDRMTDATTEWSNVISNWDDLSEADSGYPKVTISKKLAKQGIQKWLKASHGDNKTRAAKNTRLGNPTARYHKRKIVPLKTADIPKCSACRLAIAVMKKCAGCGKIKYCSERCQKGHWKKHKPLCVAGT